MSHEPHSLRDLRRVARGGSSILIASVSGNGLSYLYSIFLARSLTPDDFGVYALGLAIFNVVVLIAPLGFETGALRFISSALGRHDLGAAQRTIVQIMVLVLLSGLAAGTLLALASPWLAARLYGNAALGRVLPWFAAAVPLAVFAAVLLDVIRSFQLVRYTVLVRYLWEPCGKFVLTGLLLWAGYALTGALASLVLTSACSMVMALLAARRVASFDAARVPAFTSAGLRELFMYCLPLTVSNAFGVLAPRSDMLILGMWVSAEQVGVYSVVAQTAAILPLILAAFNTMCAPLIGEIAALRDFRRLEVLYATVARWTTACTVPLFCLLMVFGSDILAFFGRRFSSGATAMVVLAAGQVIYSCIGLASTVLLMFGHSRKIMGNTTVLALLLIGSNLLLVPRFGILGAACAVALSNIAIGVVNLWQVRSLYGMQPLTWSLAKPLLAGAVAALVSWALKGLFAPALLPLLIVLAAALYLGLLLLLRFETADRQVFSVLAARIRPA